MMTSFSIVQNRLLNVKSFLCFTKAHLHGLEQCLRKNFLRAIFPTTSSLSNALLMLNYKQDLSFKNCRFQNLRKNPLRAIFPTTSSSPYVYLYTNKKAAYRWYTTFLFGADDRTAHCFAIRTAWSPKCFAFRYRPSHLFAKNDYQSFSLRKNLLKVQVLTFIPKNRAHPSGTLYFWCG